MKKKAILILTVLFIAFACDEDPINDSFELNKLQTFTPRIIYHLENSKTTFHISDVNDSRCPANAQCVWEGMAQIDLVLHSSVTDTLYLNTYNNLSDTIEKYVFELMEVAPYPELDKEININDYRITLKISELNE